MGSTPSTPLSPDDAACCVADWLAQVGLRPPRDGHELLVAAVRRVVQSGAVAARTLASIKREGRSVGATLALCEDGEVASLATSLLLLDPSLAAARHRCVPSRLSERTWWALCLRELRAVAAAELPPLLAQLHARSALDALAPRAPYGAGALSKLPTRAVERIAAALAPPAVLALAATCRALYPLGFADGVWRLQTARAFPDVEPAGRARYEAVARGGHSVPPGAVQAVHAYLSVAWGSAECVYGGWGSPHLTVAMLWRRPGTAAVRASFEFKRDDGDTVWGGRAEEELCLVAGGGAGAPPSWAAVYTGGEPIAVEPLHGRLRGPPADAWGDGDDGDDLHGGDGGRRGRRSSADGLETEMTQLSGGDEEQGGLAPRSGLG